MGEPLAEVARSWTELGDRDPMWAALTLSGRSAGRWETSQFLSTGSEEIAAVLRLLVDRGVPPEFGTALDFGCGPGRLTAALAAAGFDQVIGLDISKPMLAKAAELVADSRCRFVHSVGTELPIETGSIDLVYTCRVLQHMPSQLAHRYIREFFRVARPGGLVVFQLPAVPAPGIAGALLRILPARIVTVLRRGMQMHGTPAAQVRQLVAQCGARVVTIEPDHSAGPRWSSYLYVAEAGHG